MILLYDTSMFTSSVYFGDRNFTLAWQMTFCQTCCPMRWLQIPFLTTALDPLDPMDPMDPMDPTCLSLSILHRSVAQSWNHFLGSVAVKRAGEAKRKPPPWRPTGICLM